MKLFSTATECFTFPPAMYKGSSFSISSPTLVLLCVCVFSITILVGVQLYLIVGFAYNSLMTNDVDHPFMCLLLLICINS